MNEFELPATPLPVDDQTEPTTEAVTQTTPPTDAGPQAVDPVRSAAGRIGARRVNELANLGRLYEQEHNLTPGRQRLKQLIQLGKRYEQEHGLRIAKPRRKRRGDAWQEFLTALARVIKPAHRPAVEQLLATLASRGDDAGLARAG